jgi:hypothetical protein
MTMYMTLLAAVDASLDLLNRAADNQNVLMQNALIQKRAHGRMRLFKKPLTVFSLVADPAGCLMATSIIGCVLVGSMW